MKRFCWAIVASLLTACTPPPGFTDSQGRHIALTQFAGKPLLVNYFAPWCAPCLREMPLLEALAQEGEIAVVVINYDPATPAELGELAKRYRLTLPLLIPDHKATLILPRPAGLPTTYLLDREGKLQKTLVGELDEQQIKVLRESAK